MAVQESFFIPTITLDGLLAAISVLGGGVVFLWRTSNKFAKLETKVDDHGKKIDNLAGVVEVQTRHDERLAELTRRVNLMDQRWEDLRHGKGMVQE